MQKTSEVYKKVYHYTNWDGLYGILKDQSLWATHCKFLNDYSEISSFGPKLIESLLPEVMQKIDELLKAYPDLDTIIKEHGGLNAVAKHETKLVSCNI